MNNSTINTGWHVTGSDILTPDGAHSGYYVSAECILHGAVDTGFYVTAEIIWRRPTVDTGFRVWGGMIYGPSRDLPFLR